MLHTTARIEQQLAPVRVTCPQGHFLGWLLKGTAQFWDHRCHRLVEAER